MKSEDVRTRLGLALKNWRKKAGISQEELAWRADLHRTYVSDIERGARNPSLDSLEKIAKALKISLSTLFKPLDDLFDLAEISDSKGTQKLPQCYDTHGAQENCPSDSTRK